MALEQVKERATRVKFVQMGLNCAPSFPDLLFLVRPIDPLFYFICLVGRGVPSL